MERWASSRWAQRECWAASVPEALLNRPCPSAEAQGLLAASELIAQDVGISVSGQAHETLGWPVRDGGLQRPLCVGDL